MADNNFLWAIEFAGGRGWEQTAIKLEEIARISICPDSQSRNAADKLKTVLEGFNDLCASNARNFLKSACGIVEGSGCFIGDYSERFIQIHNVQYTNTKRLGMQVLYVPGYSVLNSSQKDTWPPRQGKGTVMGVGSPRGFPALVFSTPPPSRSKSRARSTAGQRQGCCSATYCSCCSATVTSRVLLRNGNTLFVLLRNGNVNVNVNVLSCCSATVTGRARCARFVTAGWYLLSCYPFAVLIPRRVFLQPSQPALRL